MTEPCQLHQTMEMNVGRLRDDVSELYDRSNDHEARLRELTERDRHREDAVSKLEAAVEKGQARTEGLIQALSQQVAGLAAAIQEIKTAPARKIAARWDDVLSKAIGWITTAALGALAAWLFTRGAGK